MRIGAAIAVLFLVTSVALADVTCITVTCDRPARISLNGLAHKDGYETHHCVTWDNLPVGFYIDQLVTLTDVDGHKVSRRLRIAEGSRTEAHLSFGASSSPQHFDYRYWWLILALGVGWLVVYSFWTWHRCRLYKQELASNRQQLRSSGSVTTKV